MAKAGGTPSNVELQGGVEARAVPARRRGLKKKLGKRRKQKSAKLQTWCSDDAFDLFLAHLSDGRVTVSLETSEEQPSASGQVLSTRSSPSRRY